jgi:RNA polymerase sigma factor (TIGR02999 family)
MTSRHDITRLLGQWKNGDQNALADLVPLIYEELRALARIHLHRERRDHTLQATALVHELFIRLMSDRQPVDWQNRSHFFGIAARVMRQLLVAHARRHDAIKRGGDVEHVRVDELRDAALETDFDLTALDIALARLAEIDPAQANIVELRFFGGYTIDETAALVGCSSATVSREWQIARMWLFREIGGGVGDP